MAYRTTPSAPEPSKRVPGTTSWAAPVSTKASASTAGSTGVRRVISAAVAADCCIVLKSGVVDRETAAALDIDGAASSQAAAAAERRAVKRAGIGRSLTAVDNKILNIGVPDRQVTTATNGKRSRIGHT